MHSVILFSLVKQMPVPVAYHFLPLCDCHVINQLIMLVIAEKLSLELRGLHYKCIIAYHIPQMRLRAYTRAHGGVSTGGRPGTDNELDIILPYINSYYTQVQNWN